MPRRPTHSPRARLALVALTCVLVLAGFASAAEARVPFGFVGTNADDLLLTKPPLSADAESSLMVRAGIESVRIPFHWPAVQPYRTLDEIPEPMRSQYQLVDGVPSNFGHLDKLVTAITKRRMRILPVVTLVPDWAAKRPGKRGSLPRDPADYARFSRTLVARYGPGGTFWNEHPEVRETPIRSWQVWNEPNLRNEGADNGWPRDYVLLLRAARRAIKAVDPGAKILLAGLPNGSFNDLTRIYRQPGARRLFDTVAVHPYTREPAGVIRVLELVRRTMGRYGDSRKPIHVTEFGWPASRPKLKLRYGFETTAQGQAKRLPQVLQLFVKARRRLRIKAVFHSTWVTKETAASFPFDFSGLRRITPSGTIQFRPAYSTFRRTALRLEACTRKASVATLCARRARR